MFNDHQCHAVLLVYDFSLSDGGFLRILFIYLLHESPHLNPFLFQTSLVTLSLHVHLVLTPMFPTFSVHLPSTVQYPSLSLC